MERLRHQPTGHMLLVSLSQERHHPKEKASPGQFSSRAVQISSRRFAIVVLAHGRPKSSQSKTTTLGNTYLSIDGAPSLTVLPHRRARPGHGSAAAGGPDAHAGAAGARAPGRGGVGTTPWPLGPSPLGPMVVLYQGPRLVVFRVHGIV